MEELRLLSFAKINLSLSIQGIRPDLFHELDSVMQSVSLTDEIFISKIASGISVYCDDMNVPSGKDNIAYKAAEACFYFTGERAGVRIDIKKTIPVAAGLAGGSSDAAATLIGLDKFFDKRLSIVNLQTLGASVGSDIPFCLIGGRCRVRGRGEVVEQLPMLPKTWFVLVLPSLKVPTKWAYEEYDRWKMKGLGTREQGLGEKGKGPMHNDLEEAVSAAHPEIKRAKEALLKTGAMAASMSGSGPSVFGVAEDEAEASRILKLIKKDFVRCYSVSSVERGVKII